MEVIRDSLGGVGGQWQPRPSGPLARTDGDLRCLPVDIFESEMEDLSTAQAEPRKQRQHRVIPALQRGMSLTSAQHAFDCFRAEVLWQTRQRPMRDVGYRWRQVAINFAPVEEEAKERSQRRDKQLGVPESAPAAYLPDEPDGVLELAPTKTDFAVAILPEQELADVPLVTGHRRRGETKLGQKIAAVMLDEAFRGDRRQRFLDSGGTRSAHQLEKSAEHVRRTIGRRLAPKSAAEEAPHHTFVDITGIAMRSSQPSIETGDQLQVQPKCRRPIASGVEQRGIRFDVCGKRAVMRPGERFWNNEWQVHPASIPEGAGQPQLSKPAANDAGLCRIAPVAVRGDQRRDAAYPAIRHSRGYVDFHRLYRIAEVLAWFVIRAKRRMRFYVVASRPVDKASGLRCDQTIRLKSAEGKRNYPAPLRRIHYVDPPTGQRLVLLTNNFNLPALVIAEIYRRRWEIELFFRWIKQHLRLRGFFSTSRNGVAVQIWTAICAYLLVAIAKREMGLSQSLHQILQVISISALEKVPLPELLADSDTTTEPLDTPNQLKLSGF